MNLFWSFEFEIWDLFVIWNLKFEILMSQIFLIPTKLNKRLRPQHQSGGSFIGPKPDTVFVLDRTKYRIAQ
jgi:hypothetical protein